MCLSIASRLSDRLVSHPIGRRGRTSKHPLLAPDARNQSASVGILPEILQNMLLTQQTGGDRFAIGVHNGGAKDTFALEDPLRVMAQRAMPEVAHELLAGVEPVVQIKVVLGLATMTARRRNRMVMWMHLTHAPALLPNPSYSKMLVSYSTTATLTVTAIRSAW